MIEFLQKIDGRWYISLWVVAQTLAFALVMPRRPHFARRAVTCEILLLWALRGILLVQTHVLSAPLIIRTVICLLCTAVLCICCQTNLRQAGYASIWINMTQQALANISSAGFIALNAQQSLVGSYGRYTLLWILIAAPLVYLLAKTLFAEEYQIGRRHMAIVASLYITFETVQGVPDIKIDRGYLGANYQFVIMTGLCLLTALYLIHTLFTKKQTREALEMANALRRHQQENYELAKKNIALINRRCHTLKMQLAELKNAQSSKERERSMDKLGEAIEIYDSMLHSDNDVVDMVLAESSLYRQEHGIQLHCVSDGGQLAFLDAVDLYTLFSLMLNNAVKYVESLPDRELRQIDVSIYKKQGFVIIETNCPLPGAIAFDAAAVQRDAQELRYILQKYSAEYYIKNEHGSVAQRYLFPVHTIA